MKPKNEGVRDSCRPENKGVKGEVLRLQAEAYQQYLQTSPEEQAAMRIWEKAELAGEPEKDGKWVGRWRPSAEVD